ncbi:MAG: acetolactate synthase small subunit [candidate division NC10 bacterium]|jgi:acetolactate synthase-1/3 small subunit|nr:acetolactate synthase small subunit [candidate division NC10 bacterium]MCH7895288.1 acetolactate synthase small subunit [candidate division NC10 bacterium]MCZ6550203.1 acetolactate synthase small subunit [candidate division NC10 bacterium]
MKGQTPSQRHILTLLVENRIGVLAKIAGLIAAKGYNMDSVSVGETMDNSVSRVTLVVHGDDWVMEQMVKQLNRVVDVIKVVDLTEEDFIEREMILVRVNADSPDRAEILRIADIFRAKVVDLTHRTYTLEVTGAEDKIQALLELLRPFGIKELVRTGRIAIGRANKSLPRKPERVAENGEDVEKKSSAVVK